MPHPIDIEYNTQRNPLVIKEYGRNVQKMVEKLMAVKDRHARSEYARTIIHVMDQLNEAKNPAAWKKEKESEDYWHKLWDHLFIMSGYRLEADAPFPKPAPDCKTTERDKPEYNKHRIHYRTYGRNMENIIRTAAQYPEEIRKDIVKPLANHLKMLYLVFNRDSVDDTLIARQLYELSDGKLILPEGFVFDTTKDLLACSAQQSEALHTAMPGRKKKKKKKKKKNSPCQEP